MSAEFPITVAIDTAGSACSVAIARGEEVLAAARREMRHGHGEVLLPMIAQTAAEAALPPSAINRVAVSVGPGGFTGIRVGLAAARGIALAAAAELIGISSFEAVAAMKGAHSDMLLVALDSRRAELYVQLFEAGFAIAEPSAASPETLAEYVAKLIGARPLTVCGDAAEAAAAVLAGRLGVAIASGTAPDALGVLAAAQRRVRSGARPAPALPLYLRPPDVTMPRPRPGR